MTSIRLKKAKEVNVASFVSYTKCVIARRECATDVAMTSIRLKKAKEVNVASFVSYTKCVIARRECATDVAIPLRPATSSFSSSAPLSSFHSKRKTMKNKKTFICDISLLLVCAIIISSLGILVYTLPRKSFSEEENRMLAVPPVFSTDALLSGEWFSGLSAFYSDALPLRQDFIRLKALCELGLGKAQNNGVLFLRGGRLVDRCEYDSSQLQNIKYNREKICSLLESKNNSCTALVPRSADIYVGGEAAEAARTAAYGGQGQSGLYKKLLESTADGVPVYYLTDHHLNAEGAYILYSFVISELGLSPLPQDFFKKETFSSNFLGSTYSKCGLLSSAADTLTLYRYEGDMSYSVECSDASCSISSLYCFSAWNIKDKYRVFTDGNHPLLTVKSKKGDTRPTLLIVKDSFANACLPLLAVHFDLVVYDPRYTSVPLPECDYTALIMGIDTLANTKLII